VRVAYDTEFYERGSRSAIEFISIGMVREDGEEYYAINASATWWAIYKDEWLRANVLVHLPGKVKSFGNGGGTFEPDESSGLFLPPAQIAQEVANFCYMSYGQSRDSIELWAYYADYDHVVLSQLFGRMIDLPDHMPMYTNDLKQAARMLGQDLPEQESGEHNALEDARWVDRCLTYLQDARVPFGVSL
jgi:hypothetical protein